MTDCAWACPDRPFLMLNRFACPKVFVVLGVLGFFLQFPAQPAEPGSEVVVVFNSRLPESKEVADYYSKRRQVPQNQILGLDLPTAEAVSRKEFLEGLQ